MAIQPPVGGPQPWTCPNCTDALGQPKKWYSGVQYCTDCGYGMQPVQHPRASAPTVQNGQVLGADGRPVQSTLPPPPPLPGNIEDLYGLESHPPPPAAPPAQAQSLVDQLHAQLQASMQAESQLQADNQLLRERLTQVTAQAQEQHLRTLAGVQRLLQPLVELLTQFNMPTQPSQIVPRTVELITLLARRAQPAPPPVGSSALLNQLVADIADIKATLAGHQAPAAPAGEPYPTWVVTDQRVAAIEKAIQEAEQQHGRPYGG